MNSQPSLFLITDSSQPSRDVDATNLAVTQMLATLDRLDPPRANQTSDAA